MTDETPARRRRGQGGIESDRARGMFRGFYRDATGARLRLPWCTTRQDAEEQLQAALELSTVDGVSAGALTLRAWGETFLERRELDGHRAFRHDNNRWHQYITSAHFIDWPLESITRRDVKQWVRDLAQRRTCGRGTPPTKSARRRKATQFLSWATRKHALILLRRAFDMAIDDERVSDDFANPCHGLKIRRPASTEIAFNYLTRDEVAKMQEHASPRDRAMIEFALATGLRQGEMRALRDEDVHLDAAVPYVAVRYGGTPRKPTKSGQPRDVPLLPMAQRALRAWYALRDAWCTNNFKALTFPAQRGGFRSAGKILGRRHQEIWKGLLRSAGIQRHLVWHDLRHTCATALLGGYFGKKWRLEEIQQLLGHADVETTQIYAHQLKQTLTDAAAETTGDIGAGE